MKLIVCTHSCLLCVEMAPNLEVSEVYHLDTGYYDGSDVTRDGDIIAAVRKTDPWKGDSPCEVVWYNNYHILSRLPILPTPTVLDPHQITFDSKDRGLLMTSTADNSIVYQSVADANDTYKHFFLFGQETDDHNHINSITLTDDDKVAYIVFHNLGLQPSHIYKASWCGQRLFQAILMHDTQFNGVHNIEILDPGPPETIAFNASDDGAVIRTVWGTEDYERAEIGEGYHPKGMALTDDYVVVGWSEHAVSTPRRYISKSGLAFIDRVSWEVVAMPTILLGDGHVGNINDVRVYGKRNRCSGGESTETGETE